MRQRVLAWQGKSLEANVYIYILPVRYVVNWRNFINIYI